MITISLYFDDISRYVETQLYSGAKGGLSLTISQYLDILQYRDISQYMAIFNDIFDVSLHVETQSYILHLEVF